MASDVDGSWHGGSSPYPSTEDLYGLFARQARSRPDAPAVDAGAERLTYAALDRRSAQMAHALRALGVKEETPVGVFMGQRIEQVVAQVAIARAGGTYVPLDPDYPRERLEFMMNDAAIPVVITDRRTQGLQFGPRTRLCVDGDRETLARNPTVFPPAAPGPRHRSHILYTSGSTGKPKGIELIARGVSRLVLATDYVRISPTDRVAQIANFSFDAATFEVWGALLNGAALVMLPRHAALDPQELRATLRDRRVSVLLLTTALFNLVAQACPEAFAGLRYLLIGGERANLPAVRTVLSSSAPPRRLINAYGPTESTVIATACTLDSAALAGGVVPIGRPIANTLAYILDDAQRPVGVGETGELYVGGDGLARGYLGRPELTAERFVSLPGLTPGRELRLYRTGDLARWRPDGMIEFLGRSDFQVKIRGHRVELEEVESALLATDLLTAAAVTAQEGNYGETTLVAHVVPRDPVGYSQSALYARLEAALPRAMLPTRCVVVDGLPLNANGKVDRRALALGQAQSGVFNVAGLLQSCDPLTIELAALWAELLDVPEVTADDDFFRLGGNSLLAARLVLRVRDAYHVRFPVYTLYESGTLREFAAVVRAAMRGAVARGPNPDGPETWRTDARLPPDVAWDIAQAASAARPPRPWQTGDVLLTGATGFLGAYLLHDLLVHTQARVHCLVRTAGPAEGARRIHLALARHGLWQDAFAGRIHVVVGDLRQRRFGLDLASFRALAEAVDAVFHCGAQVNYVQPYAAHRACNVVGTAEVLRLAAAAGVARPVHHVSSLAVFGPSGFFGGNRRVHEGDSLDDHLQYLPFDIGYSASKWVSEQLVWEAGSAGLPVAVYRPGFILGDSRSGSANTDDFMGRIVRGAVQVGACPDLPRQRKEIVAVDDVSRAIVHIAGQPNAVGRAYHLVPPDPRTSTDLREFFAMIGEFGYPLETLSYPQWVERITHDARVRDNPLCPLLPMLFERVYADERTRWELYEDMPAYDATNTARALEGSGIGLRPLDRPRMASYLRRMVAQGLLPWVRPAAEAAVQQSA